MGIFSLERLFENNIEIIFEADSLKVNISKNKKEKDNRLILYIRDKNTTRSGKDSQHNVSIKVIKGIEYGQNGFPIPIARLKDKKYDKEIYDEKEAIMKLNKHDRHHVKKFIDDNRKDLIAFWDNPDDKDIQQKIKLRLEGYNTND